MKRRTCPSILNEMPSLYFYSGPSALKNNFIQVGLIEYDSFEIFDLIQGFQSADDFASWITNQRFEKEIYKNEVKEEKYRRGWKFIFNGTSFLYGELELDEKKIPEYLREQLLCLSFIFSETEQLHGIEKRNIHSILTASHYTVISHVLYNELVIGGLWKIYDLPFLFSLYEKRKDPLRYWRRMRRE